MSSGLSMSSVNKIKELATAREYSLALDIIESQDLTKSLNPQFLRTCGEVYIETKHYAEARKVLLMAHKMAPEAKRIMFSLIDLYYRIGYWDVARKYYDIYMFDADESSEETIQITYIKNKAEGSELARLRELLGTYYADNMDYQWSYELFVLLWLNDLRAEAEALYMDYSATYKNSEYADTIANIIKGLVDAKECFYIYAPQPVEDDDESQEELRQQENILLEADDLRIHPREPEITIMVDDFEEPTLGSRRKLKKFLKKYNASNEAEYSDESEEESEMQTAATSEQYETLNKQDEEEFPENDSDDVDVEEIENNSSEKKGFIWKLFNKRNPQENSDNQEDSEEKNYEEINPDEEKSEETNSEETNPEETNSEENNPEENNPEENNPEEENSGKNPEGEKLEGDYSEEKMHEEIDIEDFHFEPEEEEEKMGISVSMDIENVFEPEEDELETDEPETDELETDEPEEKSFFIFEDVKIIEDEADTDFEIDDFSDNEDDFGVEEKEELEHKIEIESIFEDSGDEDDKEDKAADELNDLFADIDSPEKQEKHIEDEMWFKLDDNEEQEEPEVYVGEIIFKDESDSDVEKNEETEKTSEAEEEDEMDVEAEVKEETEMTTEAEVEEETEMTTEAEVEEETEMTTEAEVEEETEMTTEVEAEEEVETEIDTETNTVTSIDESEYTDSVVEEEFVQEEIDKVDRRSVFEVESDKKSSYDFPVFKSSLFPNYNNESQDIENNFDSVMDEAQNKLKENMLKEEQMQKEAEALLASLGIVLEGASTDDSKQSVAVNEESDDIQQKLNREDLKASIIIDDNKKKILKKLKELR